MVASREGGSVEMVLVMRGCVGVDRVLVLIRCVSVDKVG